MNDLINKVITISAKEEKMAGGKPVMKIKDENNLSYSVWKFKQDGTESAAWGQIPDIGDVTQVGYVEDVKQHPEHGKVTYRTIRVFNKDIGNGIVNHQTQQTGKKEKDTEEFWDKKAYKQCLWGFWLNQVAKPTNTFDDVWSVFRQIEEDADKRFAKGWEKAEKIFKEELPVIQQDEVQVDDIPF